MRNTLPQLHASMGAAVLKHLSRYADLTGLLGRYKGAVDGFVAGQAVASAVSELFHDGLGVVYNDVDVFMLSEYFERPGNQALATLDFETLRLASHYRQLVVELTTVYEVCRTRRQGMLNEVLCKPLVAFDTHPRESAQAFLRSFDLNCVQVGVRLSDGALVWTPAFEHFLATRQMLVANVKTPVHTAIRWFRKKAELEGVFGHDDHAMELLAAVRARVENTKAIAGSQSYQRMLAAQSQFGRSYADKAQSVISRLGNYFDMAPTEHAHLELYTLNPRGQLNDELVQADTFDQVLPTYARALQGYWKRHVCEQLLTQLRAPEAKRGVLRMNIAVEGVEAVQALTSSRDARRLDKAVREHSSLLRSMLFMDTRQQLAFVTALEVLSAEQGLWVYGVFEQLDQKLLDTLSQVAPSNMLEQARHVLTQQHDALQQALHRRATPLKALLPAVELDGFLVEELVEFKPLAEESARLHHCVAGYWHAVVSDRCRIVRLSKPRVQESLTMELVPRGTGWANVQLRGLHNRNHTSQERQTAERYVDMVNVSLLLAQVGIRPPVQSLAFLVRKQPALMRWVRTRMLGDRRHKASTWQDRLRSVQPRLATWLGAAPLKTALKQGLRSPHWGTLQWTAFWCMVKGIVRVRLAVLAGSASVSEAPAMLAQALGQPQLRAAGHDELDDDIAF